MTATGDVTFVYEPAIDFAEPKAAFNPWFLLGAALFVVAFLFGYGSVRGARRVGPATPTYAGFGSGEGRDA